MPHDIKELMTAKEVCEMFGCSESSLKTSFNRTAASIKKKYNVDLVKMKIAGGEFVYQMFEDTRAATIYEETNDIAVTLESLKFEEFEFFVFLALSASPQGVYRGRREDLLKYLGITKNKKNIDTLNNVIQSLVEKDYIAFHEDEEYIIIYLRTAFEKEHKVPIENLKECRRIANENNKNFTKIPQLIKVWEAIKVCEQNQPFTYADLVELTGLSYKQIRDVKRLLESNGVFLTSREGSYFKCLGMNVDLNAFFK